MKQFFVKVKRWFKNHPIMLLCLSLVVFIIYWIIIGTQWPTMMDDTSNLWAFATAFVGMLLTGSVVVSFAIVWGKIIEPALIRILAMLRFIA